MSHIKRDQALRILKSIAGEASGINFTLMMSKECGYGSYTKNHLDYSFHPRFNQPCQGGETRKYSCIHGDECTQPHNEKPGDLAAPFPDGRPEAIAFALLDDLDELDLDDSSENQKAGTELFKFMFLSDDSPWIGKLGGVGNIREISGGLIIGVNHLEIDPTVMINAINTYRSISGENFVKLIEKGMTKHEALLTLMLNHNSINHLHNTYDYYFPNPCSVRRFFEGKPNDLSGGTYSDRADYNRTYIADVFAVDHRDDQSLGLDWDDNPFRDKIETTTEGWNYKVLKDLDQFVGVVKEMFAHYLKNEPDLIDHPYVYRDDSGQVIDLNNKIGEAA